MTGVMKLRVSRKIIINLGVFNAKTGKHVLDPLIATGMPYADNK